MAQEIVASVEDVERHREAYERAGATVEVEVYYDPHQDWLCIRDKKLGTLLVCLPFDTWVLFDQLMRQSGHQIARARAFRG